jgi:hypothetical protein
MWQAKVGTDHAHCRDVFAVNGVLARCGRNSCCSMSNGRRKFLFPFLPRGEEIHTVAGIENGGIS